MSIISKLFGKDDSPDQRMREAFAACRAEVAAAAERKLGRALSEQERRGIDGIETLMMLESCSQSFTSEKTSPAQVEKDVGYFAAQTKAK